MAIARSSFLPDFKFSRGVGLLQNPFQLVALVGNKVREQGTKRLTAT